MKKVIIIGGGAAGCFAGIQLARGGAEVTLLEAGERLLAKVAITGGGRCNLTNDFSEGLPLDRIYPRGHQLMRRALRAFSPEDTMRWFETEGVALTVQPDGCVFPRSQDAMQIVRTLERGLRLGGVRVVTGARVLRISSGFIVSTQDTSYEADAVLVTTGGSPKIAGLSYLSELVLKIEPPVPSLFTLRVEDAGLKALQGTLAEVEMSLAGTPFRAEGTLLLTDWGISGPATLRLSSYAARYLAENQYRGRLLINWLPGEDPAAAVQALLSEGGQKQIGSVHPSGITSRLWAHLTARAGLRPQMRCAEVGSKGAARLAALLRSDEYALGGRVHFREEFVTCGGVSLSEISLGTLEARRYPGLHFAGEVLDIDAITGGYNLQAAWSTASVAASHILSL